MGRMTRVQLINEALELSGDTSLFTRAVFWLNAALEDLYASAAWPFLLQRVQVSESAGSYYLGQGSSEPSFGENGLVNTPVYMIHKLLWADSGSGSARGEVELVNSAGTNSMDDPLLEPTRSSVRGPPIKAILSNTTSAYDWFVEFSGVLDRAYRFVVVYQQMPEWLTTDNARPIYPVDETIVQALVVKAMFHQEDNRFAVEQGKLNALKANDQVRLLKVADSGGQIELASNFHPRRGSTTWPRR